MFGQQLAALLGGEHGEKVDHQRRTRLDGVADGLAESGRLTSGGRKIPLFECRIETPAGLALLLLGLVL